MSPEVLANMRAWARSVLENGSELDYLHNQALGYVLSLLDEVERLQSERNAVLAGHRAHAEALRKNADAMDADGMPRKFGSLQRAAAAVHDRAAESIERGRYLGADSEEGE